MADEDSTKRRPVPPAPKTDLDRALSRALDRPVTSTIIFPTTR